jgi:hypothetical protein
LAETSLLGFAKRMPKYVVWKSEAMFSAGLLKKSLSPSLVLTGTESMAPVSRFSGIRSDINKKLP